MSASIRFLLLFALSALLTHCNPQPTEHHLSGSTMGTTWRAIIVSTTPPDPKLIQQHLDHLESIFSTWRNDSAIQQFNHQNHTDWHPVPPELALLTQRSLQLAKETQGAYDPTIPPLLALWGIGPNHRSHPRTIPTPNAINDAKKFVNHRLLQVQLNPPALRKLNPKLQIDLSSLVEGYALDTLAEILQSTPHTDFLLEIGGEMIARGNKADHTPWTIGIQLPQQDPTLLASATTLQNEAISTSGTYLQNWQAPNGQTYSHILDARTGTPITHNLQSVTIKSPIALEADAWSTALLILGPVEAKKLIQSHHLQAYFQEKKPR